MQLYVSNSSGLRSIADICLEVTSGGTPRRSTASFYEDGIWPWVKTKELSDSWLDRTEEYITDVAVASSSAKILPKDTILMAMYGATVGKLGILNRPMACNQACCALIVDPTQANFRYLFYQLLRVRPQIKRLATGGAQQNLSGELIKSLQFTFPPLPRQHVIADCLGSLDDLIAACGRKLEALRQHKQGLMQQLFPQPGETVPRMRFPEFKNAGPWEPTQLEDVLAYEQPRRYIVKDNIYRDTGTPVLTANKSFVLGYTDETDGIYDNVPVIIFDDFTTDTKYVDFAFKVKSSAIKILTSRRDDELRFVFELMSRIRFDPTQHKRYYISQYQHLEIALPNRDEQRTIADCLGSLDNLIAAEDRKIETLRQHKQGLMQQLFPYLKTE